MSIRSVLLIIILLSTLNCISQEQKLFHPQNVDASSINADSINRQLIVDSINNPLTYLLYDSSVRSYLLATKRSKKRFMMFELKSIEAIDSIQQVNVNKTRKNEIIIYSQESYGKSGLGGGVSSVEKCITIYDLKKTAMLFKFDYYSETQTWATVYEGDTSSVNESNHDSGIDYYCECYSIQINNRKLIFEPIHIEDAEDDINILGTAGDRKEYLSTRKGFIRLE